MESYSQINQDRLALQYFNFKRNGYFIDIGANVAKALNNTYLMESQYDWNGICIEPNTKVIPHLQEHRKCKIVNIGVYDKETTIEFESTNNTMMGGIKEHLQPKYRPLGGKEEDWKTFKIHVKPLVMILDECNCPDIIDYVSIDTEGSEYHILNGYFRDNQKYKIKYIDVEHAYETIKQNKIRELMKCNGYRLLRQNQYDDTFILE
jgi:FkbM family methyltransferase